MALGKKPPLPDLNEEADSRIFSNKETNKVFNLWIFVASIRNNETSYFGVPDIASTFFRCAVSSNRRSKWVGRKLTGCLCFRAGSNAGKNPP